MLGSFAVVFMFVHLFLYIFTLIYVCIACCVAKLFSGFYSGFSLERVMRVLQGSIYQILFSIPESKA